MTPKWKYQFQCDSCDYKTEVGEGKGKEADEHEKQNLDHWVQQVMVDLETGNVL